MTAYADAIAKPPMSLTELEQEFQLKSAGKNLDGRDDHTLYDRWQK